MSSRFAIATPCSKRWIDLPGDDRQRYCDDCGKSVHAFDQYSQEEREKLWLASEGRICAKIASESAEPQRSRRVMLAGALLTAISPLMAQTGRVRIRVTDVNGAMIVNAQVSLLREHDKGRQTLLTNEVGEVVWTDLPIGNSTFSIVQSGFAERKLTATIRGREEVKVDAVLQVGSLMGDVVEVAPHPTTPPAAQQQPKRRRWRIF